MYVVCRYTFVDEDTVTHCVYGIVGDGAMIRDISTNRDEVEALAILCNRLSLSPLHLRDVVEDWLSR